MSKKKLIISGIFVFILIFGFLLFNVALADDSAPLEEAIVALRKVFIINWPSDYPITGNINIDNLPATPEPKIVTLFENEPLAPGEIKTAPYVDTGGFKKVAILIKRAGGNIHYQPVVSPDGIEGFSDGPSDGVTEDIKMIDVHAPYTSVSVMNVEPAKTVNVWVYLYLTN